MNLIYILDKMITGSLKNRQDLKEREKIKCKQHCTPENAHTHEGG